MKFLSGHGGPPGKPFGCCWLFRRSKTRGVFLFSPWGGLSHKKNNLRIEKSAVIVGEGGA